ILLANSLVEFLHSSLTFTSSFLQSFGRGFNLLHFVFYVDVLNVIVIVDPTRTFFFGWRSDKQLFSLEPTLHACLVLSRTAARVGHSPSSNGLHGSNGSNSRNI